MYKYFKKSLFLVGIISSFILGQPISAMQDNEENINIGIRVNPQMSLKEKFVMEEIELKVKLKEYTTEKCGYNSGWCINEYNKGSGVIKKGINDHSNGNRKCVKHVPAVKMEYEKLQERIKLINEALQKL